MLRTIRGQTQWELEIMFHSLVLYLLSILVSGLFMTKICLLICRNHLINDHSAKLRISKTVRKMIWNLPQISIIFVVNANLFSWHVFCAILQDLCKKWSKTEVEGEKIKIRTAHAYCWHQQCRERVNGWEERERILTGK